MTLSDAKALCVAILVVEALPVSVTLALGIRVSPVSYLAMAIIAVSPVVLPVIVGVLAWRLDRGPRDGA